jgi:probable F420-dependent oxidoreductase
MKFWQSLQFARTRDLPLLAQAIERDTPFHGVFLGDHTVHPQRLLTPYPYTPDGHVLWSADTDWPDLGAALAAMAALTTRLRLVTSVMILPLRHPVEVAKMAATVSILASNRLALGVGVGWMHDEYHAAGLDFGTRGRRCDEMIDVMRLMWSGEMVEHHGRFFDFPRSRFSPTPQARIPIYVGGDSPAAQSRAVLRGDGWITSGLSVETLPQNIDSVRRMLHESGRGSDDFEFIATTPPDLDLIKRLRDLGANSIFNVATYDEIAGNVTAEQKLDHVRRYADRIIARID